MSDAQLVEKKDQPSTSLIVKGLLGTTSFASLVAGIRSAYKHSKDVDAKDLHRAQV